MVSAHEQGHATPTPETLPRLADALEVSPEDVLG
jgi:hypothetical protein